MGRLTMEMVAGATMEVDALGHDAKVRLGDEVFAAQPNLLGSILVLARMGVNVEFHAILTRHFHPILTHPLCEPGGSRCG